MVIRDKFPIVKYSSIEINQKSIEKIEKNFKKFIPECFSVSKNPKIILLFGELPIELKKYSGINVHVGVKGVLISDNSIVLVCDVVDLFGDNEKHILIGYNENVIKNPNYIELGEVSERIELKRPINLVGKVCEIFYSF